ncbi:MAG: amidohydrolase family protein [Bryobacteraceae bacterium]
MNCIGIDVFSGVPVEVTFDAAISSVERSATAVGPYLSAGWIDLQVNGFMGVDYNDPASTLDQIGASIRAQYSTGVTRFYPTVITGSPEDMLGALRNLANAKDTLPEGAAMDGFHVEGPHISREDGTRGAHPKRWVRPPDLNEFRRWQEATSNRVRIVTLAPEWPEAPRYIEAIVAEGVVAAIGHTAANARQISEAVSAGATLSTHLGNGAHSLIPRHPNYIWDQMADDRLMADYIVDGIHLPAAFLKTAVCAKTVDRSVLITDATACAGCPPGRYQLGEQPVELTADNRVMLLGQERLAGSALRMDRGVENLMRLAGVTLAEAVRMATTNAARAGHVPARSRGLAAGERADIIQFRFDPVAKSIRIESTYVSGKKVYQAA